MGVGAEISPLAQGEVLVGFENAGVHFIDENGGGPGVRLRKATRDKPRK